MIKRTLAAAIIFFLFGCSDVNEHYPPGRSYGRPYYGGGYYGNGYGYHRDGYRGRYNYDYDRDYWRDRERARRERWELERERAVAAEERRRLEQERARLRAQEHGSYRREAEHCPAGFRPSEQKCSREERKRGCKDIRLPGGLGCVRR